MHLAALILIQERTGWVLGMVKYITGLTSANEGDGLRPMFYTFSSKYIRN